MQNIIQLYTQNHVVINFLIAIAIYVFVHWKAAFAYVRKRASQAMFGVEKSAQQLQLNSGDAKMQLVTNMVYQKLPGWVRAVVSMNRFRRIAQTFYDDAKVFIDQNAVKPKTATATTGGNAVSVSTDGTGQVPQTPGTTTS